ncbi:MAG: metallophosphoesterase [Frankiaceae bacterium]|nr:metallophosphoesterase [Frankiaceae bacterium]MBV9869926.1 metallophosphoesterase [Frankiaceae bacterium]
MGPVLGVPLGLAVAGAGAGLYGWAYERKAFRLRRYDVPILPPDAKPITVLHVSDMHFTPGQEWKVEWVRSLGALEPDLVINTGDNLASRRANPIVVDALGPLLDRPGAFVPGSNDWFLPVAKNPARYLVPDDGERRYGEPLNWNELRTSFTDAGWLDLTHRRTTIDLGGLTVELGGVSDAHLKADHYDRIAGPVSADVAIGLSHCPEPRLIDSFTADGFSLVMSGHTHGGQLRVPGVGALVTNCGLPRRRARGLTPWGPGAWLHVSAGLGTSPYAPVRFACHPEASLLTLIPRTAGAGVP